MIDEPDDILDPNHPFYSAIMRLRRGQEHATNLDRKIREFFHEKPHELVREVDPVDPSYQLLKFKFTKQLSTECTLIAAEALESLRFALDQVAYAAAIVSGKVSPRKTQFPISDSPEELANLIEGRKVCRDVPDEIVALFRKLRPYKRSDSTLWALNKLRNNGHTVLIPVQVGSSNVVITHHRDSEAFEALNPVYDRTKHEIVFGRARIGHPLHYSVSPHFNVCFEHTIVGSKQYAAGFLYNAVGEVHSIVRATEAECRRLGYI
jgi:hypothetical protein